jgi:hypothetical protein
MRNEWLYEGVALPLIDEQHRLIFLLHVLDMFLNRIILFIYLTIFTLL